MKGIGDLKPSLEAKKESHDVLVELLLRKVRDFLSDPPSIRYSLGVSISQSFQRITMSVALFDALSSSKCKISLFM